MSQKLAEDLPLVRNTLVHTKTGYQNFEVNFQTLSVQAPRVINDHSLKAIN